MPIFLTPEEVIVSSDFFTTNIGGSIYLVLAIDLTRHLNIIFIDAMRVFLRLVIPAMFIYYFVFSNFWFAHIFFNLSWISTENVLQNRMRRASSVGTDVMKHKHCSLFWSCVFVHVWKCMMMNKKSYFITAFVYFPSAKTFKVSLFLCLWKL